MAEIIHCQKCKMEIGKVVIVADLKLLKMNGIYVTNLKGVCGNCGVMFFYSVSMGELSKAVAKLERV